MTGRTNRRRSWNDRQVVSLDRYVEQRRSQLIRRVEEAQDEFCALCLPYGLEAALAVHGPTEDICPILHALVPRMPTGRAIRVLEIVTGVLHMNAELRRLRRFFDRTPRRVNVREG